MIPRAIASASKTRLAMYGALVGVALVGGGALVAITHSDSASAAVTAVPLGTAGSFSVLAGAGVSDTGPTSMSGDLGTFPTTSIAGSSSLTVHGANHHGDAVTQGAKTALVTAYDVAAGEGPTSPIAADLAGRTLKPGIYNSASSIGLTGALTLDAVGDPNALFVFQAGSALTTSSGSTINLVNGAQACNVYWKIGSSATLGTGSTFRGTVIALQSITVTTGVTIDGRVLARNGAVTLDTDTITRSACLTGPVSTTPATTTPATTTPGTTTPGATTPTSTRPGTTTPGTTTPGTTTPAAPLTPAQKKNLAAAKKKRAAARKRLAAAKPPVIRKVAHPKPPHRTFGFTG